VATLIGVRASAASKHPLPARSSGPMEDSLAGDQPEGQDAGDVLRNAVALGYYWCNEAPRQSWGLFLMRSFPHMILMWAIVDSNH
jgi:hypothetical protein